MTLQMASFHEDLKAINHDLTAYLGEAPATSAPKPTAQELEPVDIRTFITHEDYCGDTGFWPKPLLELEQMLAPGCKGAVIEKGIRGSKSYTTCYIPVYLTYRLMFEEVILGVDPRIKYHLDPVATVIYNAIFTINGKLAKRLFYYISNFIERCKWFKRPDVTAKLRINPDVTSEIQFCPVINGKIDKKAPRYAIYPGNSKLTSAAGVALYTYILDECNLFAIAESAGSSGKDYAEELDEECDQRVTSSFGADGQRIYISRRNTVNDFTSRKKEKWESLPDGHKRYYIPPPKTSWDGWPEERCKEEEWRLFIPERCDWAKDSTGKNQKAEPWEEIQELAGLWVPERFWDNFSTNPESALKVLASIPAEAQSPYMRRRDLLAPDFGTEEMPGLLNPILPHVRATDWTMEGIREEELPAHFDSLVADWFHGAPGEWYHFHVDPALNRAETDDTAGMAVARNAGIDDVAYIESDRVAERCVLVDVELILQLKAAPGSEIRFSRIREILYWLRDHRGFRFLQSSYDGWQSVDAIQTLEARGFDVDTLSVDRNITPYETFKSAKYEDRVALPCAHGQTASTTLNELRAMARAGDPCAILQIELMQLEIINGKKIDHPPHGSKDLADAVCGAVFHAVQYIRPQELEGGLV